MVHFSVVIRMLHIAWWFINGHVRTVYNPNYSRKIIPPHKSEMEQLKWLGHGLQFSNF